MLPQGGFQSVNLSITSQERCKVPDKKDVQVIGDDYVSDTYGYGQQDVSGDAYGVEDTDDIAKLQSSREPSQQDTENKTQDVKEEKPQIKLDVEEDSLLQMPKDF